MKKIISVILVCLCTFSLVGCGTKKESEPIETQENTEYNKSFSKLKNTVQQKEIMEIIKHDDESENYVITIKYEKSGNYIFLNKSTSHNSMESISIYLYENNNQEYEVGYFETLGARFGNHIPSITARFRGKYIETKEGYRAETISYEVDNESQMSDEQVFGTQEKQEEEICKATYIFLLELDTFLKDKKLKVSLKDFGFEQLHNE